MFYLEYHTEENQLGNKTTLQKAKESALPIWAVSFLNKIENFQ